MKARTFVRHVREGWKSLGRNGWMSFAAVSAVTVTLFILGIFLLLAMNVNHVAEVIEDQVEIRVSLELEADESVIRRVEHRITAMPEVSQVEFISKEEGLKQLEEDLGDASLLEGIEENPLPDVFRVETFEPQQTKAVAANIEQFDGVDNARYGEEFTDRLFNVTKTVRNVGVVLIVLLGLTAMFLISNTIRLTILARRREIEIMKLVGATNWFIRWPFFIEGLLIGLLGAILPSAVLLFGYYSITTKLVTQFELWFLDLLPMYPLAFQVTALLLGIGTIIGAMGSFISIHRFLKV
ncbi:MAG: permease-like cell division protein FtsX [Novibacillus thermophilus]|jgi:cell division transport system permease protein|uniref:Cell division protein FtsX n=1 Tax=Novibacillus thermophilus TaxID=1471761 RepID=A0A1U9KAK9_9BACL|nr:permease-like cell division protein FtsX [Novibacillus thermophilus]AQS57074.1 cell division protein FtsX [Novibacillus thermophilus]